VWSNDTKVDPVGACVGMKGARVKNIVRELNNEKVDIIRWSDDPEEFVHEALKPAILRSVTVDEDNHVVNVTVDEEDLSKAIGRRGQNARLSSRLMGWDVQVRKDESKKEEFEAKLAGAAHSLAESLGLDDELGDKLILAGGATADVVVEMPVDYLAQALQVDDARARRILVRAHALVGREAPAELLPQEEPAAEVASVEEEAAEESAPEASEEEAPATDGSAP
jgi:N utilization substance protein A